MLSKTLTIENSEGRAGVVAKEMEKFACDVTNRIRR